MNYEKLLKEKLKNENFWIEFANLIREMKWKNFKNEEKRNLARKILRKYPLSLTGKNQNEFHSLKLDIKWMFDFIQIPKYENNQIKTESISKSYIPKLIKINQNPEELKYYWREYHDQAGSMKFRKNFKKFIEYKNQEAELNGFTSYSHEWLDRYDDFNLLKEMQTIYDDILPLYLELHAYVRYRLGKFHGQNVVPQNKLIPLHLIGHFEGENWSSILNIISPFPDPKKFNITDQMLKNLYFPRKMYFEGENYFTSMNLSQLSDKFWCQSFFDKTNQNIKWNLHVKSIWYFYHENGFRIAYPTEINFNDFQRIISDLSEIYYLKYQKVSPIHDYTDNLKISKLFGDIILLSFKSPKNLQNMQLIQNYHHNQENQINRLFLSALENIVRLPLYLAVEKHRMALFEGKINENQWNHEFWRLREQLTGLTPPIKRNDNNYDILPFINVFWDNLDLIRDFMSFAVKHQIYKSACIMAEEYDPNNSSLPLDNCNFYGNVKVGNTFKSMLSIGSSKSWIDLVEKFTGERNINGKGIADYYEPLRVWLKAENAKNNVTLGWELTYA